MSFFPLRSVSSSWNGFSICRRYESSTPGLAGKAGEFFSLQKKAQKIISDSLSFHRPFGVQIHEGDGGNPPKRLEQAQDPQSLPATLRKLFETGSVEELRALAKNPNLPSDILSQLGGLLPREVFENPATPLVLLEKPDFKIPLPPLEEKQVAVAKSLSNSLPDFEKWVRDEEVLVRAKAANHPNMPPHLLNQLSYDSSTMVMELVIRNPSTSAETLLAFYRDDKRRLQVKWDVEQFLREKLTSDE